jgi:nucleoside 2-deoxyribosyltransferase
MNVFISYSRNDRAFAEQLRNRIQPLGANVSFDQAVIKPGENWEQALRKTLEDSDGVVLVVPEPGTAKANVAFFEAGAARALGKPVVVVLPSQESSRIREVPSEVSSLAVLDGSQIGPEALAKKIVSTLEAA